MKSTVKKDVTMLPGWDNVEAEQHGPVLHLQVGGVSNKFHRNDYDCDPSFVYEVEKWALYAGGKRTS